MGKVNIDTNGRISRRFNIELLPTFVFLKEGKYYTFQGNHTEKELLDFINGGYNQANSTEIPPPIAKSNQTDDDDDDDDEKKFVWPEDPDTVILNSTNIEKEISSHVWLIEFYAPWCQHVNTNFLFLFFIFYILFFIFYILFLLSSVVNFHLSGLHWQPKLKPS